MVKITYTFDFERYIRALYLKSLDLIGNGEPQIEIEPPHTYNLLDNIIIVGETK